MPRPAGIQARASSTTCVVHGDALAPREVGEVGPEK